MVKWRHNKFQYSIDSTPITSYNVSIDVIGVLGGVFMNREEMICKSVKLYLSLSEKKQKDIDCIIKANNIGNIANERILDIDKLNEAVEEMKKMIC